MGSIYTTQLERLLRSSRLANDPDAKVVLSRLCIEVKHRLSTGAPAFDFFVDIARSLARIKGSVHAEMRLQCLYDCARFFYLNECGTEALEALRQMELLATKCGDRAGSRKANNLLGVVFADFGNIAAAVPHYCKALDLAIELEEHYAQAASLINLGVALNYGGLYREAIPCLRRAFDIASSIETTIELTNPALTNLAQSHMHLGEFEEGFQVIQRSLAQSREPEDAVMASGRAIREFTYVQFAFELGNIEDAEKHTTLCRNYALRSGTARAQALADIAFARLQICTGNAAAGISLLETILDRAGAAATKEVALLALVRAYDQTEKPEKALACLDTLIAHVREAREKGVAALLSAPAHARAAISSEESDLKSLRYREATLRAKVAERKTLSAQIEMLERFAITADLRCEMSGEHGYRVGRLSALLAEKLGWKRDAITALELGARLHDIGKLGIPDRILLNSKQLEEVERHFICAHTTVGAELLGRSRIPHLRVAEEVAHFHHEWWNGKGYPHRLSGTRIPVHARIVALADVFDALTHGRPYAQSWPVERALEEISRRRGTQFDSELTDLFVNLVARAQAENSDLDAYLGRGAAASPFVHARNRIHVMLSAERAELDAAAQIAAVQ